MSPPIDPKKLSREDLDRLEALLQQDVRRRDQEKIERGEAVEIPVLVVIGIGEEGDAIADFKKRKTDELRARADKRPIVWTTGPGGVSVILTGVPRHGEKYSARLDAERAAGVITPIPNTPKLGVTGVEEPAPPRQRRQEPEPEPESEPVCIQVEVRRPRLDGSDPGQVELGSYTIRGNVVRVFTEDGRHIGSAQAADSPAAAARRVLLDWYREHGTPGPLTYNPAAIV
jgi:hypothetical protein